MKQGLSLNYYTDEEILILIWEDEMGYPKTKRYVVCLLQSRNQIGNNKNNFYTKYLKNANLRGNT